MQTGPLKEQLEGQEAAGSVRSASRKSFLATVGGAGAATLLGACGSGKAGTRTPGQGSKPALSPADLKIANYALMLEYLEVAFYQQVLRSRKVKGPALDVVKTIADDENQHVETLESAIKKSGGTPVAKPKPNLPPLTGQSQILELASTFENLGASAYLGQGAMIKDKDFLATALSIHSVEARHASVINSIIGKDPVVGGSAFAKPATMPEVLMAVKPFIAS